MAVSSNHKIVEYVAEGLLIFRWGERDRAEGIADKNHYTMASSATTAENKTAPATSTY